MTNEHEVKKISPDHNEDAALKPEPETLHTTDPQKKMEGPISSFVKKLGENLKINENQEEADKKKEENI